MSLATIPASTAPVSIVDEIAVLGFEVNANQYKIVRLAADYDVGLEWFDHGYSTPATAIAQTLDICTSTAREWIRVGHALAFLPMINDAFGLNELSYAKTRILTRWATPENEHELLELAYERSANRLTVAIAKRLAGEESDAERDLRQHDSRGVTVSTDGDGMTVIRVVLPPTIGKQVTQAIDTIVQQVAATPIDDADEDRSGEDWADASADALQPQTVTAINAVSSQNASADASSMEDQLRELKQRWQPDGADDGWIPSLAQQRADALVLLFLGKNIELATEVVIHIRGDGATFDDGTPVTESAVCQRLDQSFIRTMIHDAARKPVNASNRRRHPTTRQKRIVLETHNHECVDCQRTDLLELDHNPPFHETKHTITTELEPRCAPCHRARHRRDRSATFAVMSPTLPTTRESSAHQRVGERPFR